MSGRIVAYFYELNITPDVLHMEIVPEDAIRYINDAHRASEIKMKRLPSIIDLSSKDVSEAAKVFDELSIIKPINNPNNDRGYIKDSAWLGRVSNDLVSITEKAGMYPFVHFAYPVDKRPEVTGEVADIFS